jgi:YndJ-like protein
MKLSEPHRKAVAGAFLWLIALLIPGIGVIEMLFLWAPLVIIPLGLDLIPTPDGLFGRIDRAVRMIQPFAAAFAVASFLFPPGWNALLFAIPWVAVCGALALLGAARFARRGRWDPVELCTDAALGLIAVGGFGLAASRLGLALGFKEPIILLTAVHFHYTGFVAPLLIGFAGRKLGPKAPVLFAAAAVVLGSPLTAIGFMFSPTLKFIAVLWIAMGMIVFAWLLMRVAAVVTDNRPRFLFMLASLSLLIGMGLVAVYSIGEVRQRLLIEIPAMAWFHGIVNAGGFATCGLLGARAAGGRIA